MTTIGRIDYIIGGKENYQKRTIKAKYLENIWNISYLLLPLRKKYGL